MEKPLVNRVAQSGLLTINLEDFYPTAPIAIFDIKDYLFKGLILREKDFRTALKEQNWTQYTNQNLAIYCSVDAIIPTWAYQLVTIYATPFAKTIAYGDEKAFVVQHYQRVLSELTATDYEDKRIIIKGCSDKDVPMYAYVELTRILQPYAKTIMFGEPCSTVPLYKKK